MDYVSLWTRQHEDILPILEKEGIYHAKEAYIRQDKLDISDYFMELYQFFIEHAQAYVKRPKGALFPIWCSISNQYMLRKIENTIVLQLHVPKKEVVYFNGAKWDLVLNYQYLAKDEQDRLDFQQRCQNYGLTHTYPIMDPATRHFYTSLQKQLKKSWVRIFEVDPAHNIFTTQANIWEIRKEMIHQIY